MADGLFNTTAKGLGAPLTLGVDTGTLWSTQTEGYAGYGLGLSFTVDKKLPATSRYVFKNDKGDDLFVTGIALGLGVTPTVNLIRDENKTGIFAFTTEVPLEFRVPIPLGNSALAVIYANPKASFSASEAPPAPVEGVTPDPTAEVHLVPTASGSFNLVTGAAFYLTTQKDGAYVAGSPLLDVNFSFAPLNLIDGGFVFADALNPGATIPKTEWSFTLQPPAAWTGKVAGFKANYKLTSSSREVKDAAGEVVTDYRDTDHSLTLTGATPFIGKSKLGLKLTRSWTEDTGVESYHYGSGNAYGQTLGATATLKAGEFWKVYGNRQRISVDQALADTENLERLTDQVPFEFSLGYSQKEQTYLSEGEYLYSEGAPVLGEDDKPVAYDGSATFYDVQHLPNSDPSIDDGLGRVVTVGIKAAVPLGAGELTTTISLPFDISPSAEDEDFFQRFRDPTGNNHTIAIAYEMPLGGSSSRAAKTEMSSVATRVLTEWDVAIREDLTRASGKYKFTEDQAYEARDIVRAYMTAKDTNWTDLQKEFDDLVADKEKDNSGLTMFDFIIIMEWCNDTGRGIGSFKDVAEKKDSSLHEFAQEWKAEKTAKEAE